MHYPNLPRLTSDEFDALVRAARSHGKNQQVISDNSVAMACAVLIDGFTYKQAALSHGKADGAFARAAVALLLRHLSQGAPVLPHELFRAREAETNGIGKSVTPKYPNLPNLALGDFEALVAMARSRKNGRKPISDRSVAMARAVLLEGATYTEAGLANDRPASSVHQVVSVVLQYLNRVLPDSQHDSFEATAKQ